MACLLPKQLENATPEPCTWQEQIAHCKAIGAASHEALGLASYGKWAASGNFPAKQLPDLQREPHWIPLGLLAVPHNRVS